MELVEIFGKRRYEILKIRLRDLRVRKSWKIHTHKNTKLKDDIIMGNTKKKKNHLKVINCGYTRKK